VQDLGFRISNLPWEHLTSEKISIRRVGVETGNDFVNRAPFAKRGHYRAILKRPKIPVYSKSGEFGENGTITFFPGLYKPQIEISSS
jgi:hypothetical protein